MVHNVLKQASGFDYDLSDINCPTFAIPTFVVGFIAPNSLTINLQGLDIQCGGNYWYKPHGSLHAAAASKVGPNFPPFPVCLQVGQMRSKRRVILLLL